MVTYREFMSVALDKCASGQTTEQRKRTFGQLAQVWNENKAELQDMSKAEVRQELVCPRL